MKNIYSLIIIICFSLLLCDQNSTNHNTNSHDLNHKHKNAESNHASDEKVDGEEAKECGLHLPVYNI